MNGTTPAIERAAEAIVREEGIIDWNVLGESLRDYPRGLARACLAAALDVNEMARAIWGSTLSSEWVPVVRWDMLHEETREGWRGEARAVIAAILGSDQ